LPEAHATPTDLGANAVAALSSSVNGLLADAFALYLKTKNFHWHMSGPHFRDYHLMLDEHSDQIFATTDPLAERVRKLGGKTLRSIGDVARRTVRKWFNESAGFRQLSRLLSERIPRRAKLGEIVCPFFTTA